MSDIVIKEVKAKKDWNKFTDFPERLYKGNKCYVPTLHMDVKNLYNREKNPSYEYCDSIEIMALMDNKVVGTLTGIINPHYNEKTNEKYLRFSNFEVIDDFEVTKAMFDYICKWGKEKGMEKLNGPIGFTDIDKQGMLIEGYDVMGMSITNYNYPYYVEHMQKLGLVKEVDHVEYVIKTPETLDPRVEKVNNALLTRFGFELKKFKTKDEFRPYMYKAFDVYNEAFYALHGTVFLTKKQIGYSVNQFINYVDFDYVPFIVNKDDEVVGFAALAPSIAKAMQKSKGKLLPFGWIHLLRALKHNDTLEMYMIAINPKYQGFGLNSILMADVSRTALRKGIKYAQTGPELEDNYKVRSQWENFDAKLIRKRRIFVGDIK